MNLYKTVTYIILIAVAGFITSCSDFIDVNKDPDTPTSVPEALQLSALESNFSYEVLGNDPARTTSEWIKQTAFNGVPPSEDNYDVTSSDVNNLWNVSYVDVMNNAIELDTLASQNGNYAYSGIAKVIFAWNLAITTDLWGQIPYTEAFNPSNSTPAYDSQESIYGIIFDKLDAAIADFGKDSPMSPSSDDLLYGGEMATWKKLAYTLKARYKMHLTNAPGYDDAEQSQAALDALQNGFTGNEDNANFTYYDTQGQENPFYQFAIDSKWDTRNQLSLYYIDLLKSIDDPRLSIQARPAGAVDGDGVVSDFDPSNREYVGHENGENGENTESISSIGTYYSAADAPLNWLNYAEAKFIETEATYRTQGASAAQPVFKDAVRASLEMLGVSGTDADTYINSLPSLNNIGDPLEEIIKQKYIANFLHFEPYNDWRRTGYPEIDPITNNPLTPSGIIPVRYPYPSDELNNNAESVSDTGVPSGYPSLEEHIWWDSTSM